jgi:hypothetical protein
MSWITKLFKREDRTPEHGEIIYHRKLTLNDVFLGPGYHGPLDIITYVMKITDYKGRVKYEIHQNLPLTKNPFYDGDYATNRTVERYGHSEWIRAEYARDKDKIESQSKAEQPCHPEE